jgi:uncharacterized repeat protein (TIGR03803 family)
LGTVSAALMFLALIFFQMATPVAQAQSFSVLYDFTGQKDGSDPFDGVIEDSAGNFYGTAVAGGEYDGGVVFQVTSAGTETVLYSFTGFDDGGVPFAPVLRDTAGDLYGTATTGGTKGFGVVFKVTKTGAETVLHSFAGGTKDGCSPYGGLVKAKSGNYYGTTIGCGASGYGTVYEMSPSGKVKLLHSFALSDGAYPWFGNLLIDSANNLYGVTSQGGANNSGVVYKLTPSGTLTVLYSFAGGSTDGCYPFGTPVMDTAGNLYGTASECGPSGLGILWKLSKTGTETILHAFAGGTSDGGDPLAGVIRDSQGNLYGATKTGGTSGEGTVYRFGQGQITLLHSFSGSDGASPYGGLSRDTSGDLHGTTWNLGTGCCGTLWSITP